ncbi:prepilin-type N-terminal cleavage/methylation domain-containing protein [Desulfovibrio aminophilus]|nr:prepilin-type N-terminal cleavage/methylation domain-containing protein [Desulfovibrio aminophilus]MCM0756945.1 prepilin-type N-terminal cleavage/methylation domain-containing protein [Desulfovibrio aminophilus]
MSRRPQPRTGFTMLEIIVVIVVLGILSAIIAGVGSFMDVTVSSQAGVLRDDIRYVQIRAMRSGAVFGLKSNGTALWMFAGTNPDSAAARLPLPGEVALSVVLTDKGIGLNAFTLFFDSAGRPYSAYSSPTVNTPVSGASPLALQVSRAGGGGGNQTLSITPETGFVP